MTMTWTLPAADPSLRTPTPTPTPAPTRAVGARLVVLGGIPGSGKSTAMATVETGVVGVRFLDSQSCRRRLALVLPQWLPYSVIRPLVHLLHHVTGLVWVLRGPSGGALVVHDPSTRSRRRRALALLARARGWQPVFVGIDVDSAQALAGQRARGRVVRSRAFVGHVRRWQEQRARLQSGNDGGAWTQVRIVTRDGAAQALHAALTLTQATAQVQFRGSDTPAERARVAPAAQSTQPAESREGARLVTIAVSSKTTSPAWSKEGQPGTLARA